MKSIVNNTSYHLKSSKPTQKVDLVHFWNPVICSRNDELSTKQNVMIHIKLVLKNI